MRILNINELAPEFKFYRCGSPNLKDYLIENGIEYVYSYRSNKSNRIIWVFISCERLNNLLSLWTLNKPSGGEQNG